MRLIVEELHCHMLASTFHVLLWQISADGHKLSKLCTAHQYELTPFSIRDCQPLVRCQCSAVIHMCICTSQYTYTSHERLSSHYNLFHCHVFSVCYKIDSFSFLLDQPLYNFPQICFQFCIMFLLVQLCNMSVHLCFSAL